MTNSAPAEPRALPLSTADLFARYHAGWETRDPALIASLHAEDSVFQLHDGSLPVLGRQALEQHCLELFARFHWSFEVRRTLFGPDHWVFEWNMVLALAEPEGTPFSARIEMVDVVTLSCSGEVKRKDVYMNGTQAQAAFTRAGITR